MEILQWGMLFILGGAVVFLLWDRGKNRAPAWLSGIDEDDLVTQTDLDQYHHRVVQLSQTQREVFEKKILTLETRYSHLAKNSSKETAESSALEKPSEEKTVDSPTPEWNPAKEGAGLSISSSETDVARAIPEAAEDSENCSDEFEREDEMVDPASKVLSLWRSGKPVETIARELRMGRQEVQLLIEMSRHPHASLSKV